MNVCVTGAAGFLGRYIVAEGLRRGHRIRALVRPGRSDDSLPWSTHARLDIAHVDLLDPRAVAEALAGVDAVVHAAARKDGDLHAQTEGTVRTTEALLSAMDTAHIGRLIAIGTFSIYAALSLPSGAEITEDTPLDPHLPERDDYAKTKHLQETMIRETAAAKGWDLTVVRPGIVFGPGATWNASLGLRKGNRIWLQFSGDSTLPLNYVEHCAEIAMLSVECPGAIGQTINAVDDDLPTVRQYLQALRRLESPGARIVPVPMRVLDAASRVASGLNKGLLAGKIGLPGLLVPARLHARFKPRTYSNRRAHAILRWTPRYGFEAALARSVNGEAEQELRATVEDTA